MFPRLTQRRSEPRIISLSDTQTSHCPKKEPTMPPAKISVVQDTPKKAEKPVAGSNWFKPWIKPRAVDVAKKTPEAAIKAKPKKQSTAVAKKAPKAIGKAKPKK